MNLPPGPKNCLCILTRGKNRGKRCHELRNYCKNASHKKQNYGHSFEMSNKTTTRRYPKNRQKEKSSITDFRSGLANVTQHKPVTTALDKINQRLSLLEKKTSKPTITFKQYNQYNQQVIVLAPNDNYVSKLTELLGSSESALQYLENCARGKMHGDVNLFNRLYLQDRKIPPFFPSTNGVKLITSDGNLINDISGKQTIKNYCNNSQSAYLEMITSKIIKDLHNRSSRLVSPKAPSGLLSDQAMLQCTGKCASLSDPVYQKRLLKELMSTVENAIREGHVSSEKEAITVQLDGRRRSLKKILRLTGGHCPPKPHTGFQDL